MRVDGTCLCMVRNRFPELNARAVPSGTVMPLLWACTLLHIVFGGKARGARLPGSLERYLVSAQQALSAAARLRRLKCRLLKHKRSEPQLRAPRSAAPHLKCRTQSGALRRQQQERHPATRGCLRSLMSDQSCQISVVLNPALRGDSLHVGAGSFAIGRAWNGTHGKRIFC